MKKGKIVIIDDDIVFAKRLKKLLQKYYDEDIVILCFFDWEYINNNEIDLIFLDIEIDFPKELNKEVMNEFPETAQKELKRQNGIKEAIKLRKLKRWDIHIIFVTTHGSLIHSSMDASPFHFIDKSKLDETIPRVVSSLNRRGFRKQRILKLHDLKINVDEMIYIESKSHEMHLCTVHGKEVAQIRTSMDELENELSEFKCIRVHKSYIVNMTFVKKKYFERLILFNDTEVPIGRKYTKAVKMVYARMKMSEEI